MFIKVRNRFQPKQALFALMWLCLLSAPLAALAENKIEVEETFFRLTFDEETKSYQKIAIETARPGDLIELRIQATNIGESSAKNVELVNTLPGGISKLVEDSFDLDDAVGEYRLSRTGKTFFPPTAEIPPQEIRYVQWLIYQIDPGESTHLSYRIRIPEP